MLALNQYNSTHFNQFYFHSCVFQYIFNGVQHDTLQKCQKSCIYHYLYLAMCEGILVCVYVCVYVCVCVCVCVMYFICLFQFFQH